MAADSYNQLKVDVGLTDLTECTPQENESFAEMEKNGTELPADICKAKYDGADGKPLYYHSNSEIPPEKEELFVLMRISKDLHFIKVLFQVLLVLSILSVVAAFIIGQL